MHTKFLIATLAVVAVGSADARALKQEAGALAYQLSQALNDDNNNYAGGSTTAFATGSTDAATASGTGYADNGFAQSDSLAESFVLLGDLNPETIDAESEAVSVAVSDEAASAIATAESIAVIASASADAGSQSLGGEFAGAETLAEAAGGGAAISQSISDAIAVDEAEADATAESASGILEANAQSFGFAEGRRANALSNAGALSSLGGDAVARATATSFGSESADADANAAAEALNLFGNGIASSSAFATAVGPAGRRSLLQTAGAEAYQLSRSFEAENSAEGETLAFANSETSLAYGDAQGLAAESFAQAYTLSETFVLAGDGDPETFDAVSDAASVAESDNSAEAEAVAEAIGVEASSEARAYGIATADRFAGASTLAESAAGGNALSIADSEAFAEEAEADATAESASGILDAGAASFALTEGYDAFSRANSGALAALGGNANALAESEALSGNLAVAESETASSAINFEGFSVEGAGRASSTSLSTAFGR